MKRLRANGIGADAGKPKRQQQQQLKSEPVGAPGIVSVSPNKKSKGPWPVCHTCGLAHKGGWEKYNQISKKLRANISKFINANRFDNKNGGGGDTTTAAKTSVGTKPTK